MENDIIIERRKMITGNDCAVFQRAKVFFPLHAVDNQHVFFDEVEKIMVADKIRHTAFYLAGQFLTKVIDVFGQKLFRGRIVFHAIVKKSCRFLFRYLI